MASAVAPVSETERHESLDVLRGFAVLGILVMNIQSFAMPFAAYFNPTALGPPSDVDFTIWTVKHLFADQKFMTIFSLLFGAGIWLFSTRAAERGGRPAVWHYRRMFWLLVFGLIHAYLLWYGDILVLYAVCGMLVYPLRKLGPRTLLIVGAIVIAVASVFNIAAGLTIDRWPAEAVADMQRFWAPNSAELANEIAAFRGGLVWLSHVRDVDLGYLASRRPNAGGDGATEAWCVDRSAVARVLPALSSRWLWGGPPVDRVGRPQKHR